MELTCGQVVEFLENQRFLTSVVLARKNSRYHCLTEKGKEVNISRNRFIHISSQRVPTTRQDALKELKKISARRQELESRINIPELWELTLDEQEVWSPFDLSGLAFNEEITPDHEAAVIRAVIDDHTYFKFRDGSIHVMPRLVVERLLEQRAREAERLKKLVAGGRWLEGLWHDDLENSDVSEQDRQYWIEAIKDVCLKGDESRFYQEVNVLSGRPALQERFPFSIPW
jgi:exoribonuclease-2